MKDAIKLIDWEVVARNDPYMPPEHQSTKVSGTLVNDTKYRDGPREAGKKIVSSPIMSCRGRIVRTRNSVYELVGRPSKEYAQWCEERGISIDLKHPVVFRVASTRSRGTKP